MNNTFIKTSDKDTVKLLLDSGFKVVCQSGGVYTFVNDSNLRFSNEKMDKVVYSNKIEL